MEPIQLEGLSEKERQEALEAAAIAKRAEERAEQRALAKALEQKKQERQREAALAVSRGKPSDPSSTDAPKIAYVPKRKRQVDAQKQQEHAKREAGSYPSVSRTKQQTQVPEILHSRSHWSKKEQKAVQSTYLGKSAIPVEPKPKKRNTGKKITFRFEWDATDDTYDNDDLLYQKMVPNAGNRKKDISSERRVRNVASVEHKPLSQMTIRDWRIIRENYEISVKGGKAPPPLRSFRESPSPELPQLHNSLLDAIENVMGFKSPSPIQRQAIPIGLQRRDLIGIAETGSGKTVAFGVPLCHYLLNLPSRVLQSVKDEGPLALVMAPTRELALQINEEFGKLLSRQSTVKVCGIVGGQSIQQQAQDVRNGVHIVVGTPGRINECLDMAYMVLNQCCYIVLDEADRMIDMGFAPQIETILDACGGTLKSENEKETYQQEMEDLRTSDVARHRLTAMFSATMPPEVERIAKNYLRHPAVVSVGDKDSGKNKRIEQRIIFLASPSLKEKVLVQQLRDRRFAREKVIVFVNEKKHAEGVGRTVERSGRSCVVLHGGKSQEQREENLAAFRRGNVVLVATDVAGRGLDIPDVAHVINYDLPSRSIESYTHRIGRTGRAGKEGVATSFITDQDETIMAPLKAYLESTGNTVPDRLARHPAANSDRNNLIH